MAHHYGIPRRSFFEELHVGGIMPRQFPVLANGSVSVYCDNSDDHNALKTPFRNVHLCHAFTSQSGQCPGGQVRFLNGFRLLEEMLWSHGDGGRDLAVGLIANELKIFVPHRQ